MSVSKAVQEFFLGSYREKRYGRQDRGIDFDLFADMVDDIVDHIDDPKIGAIASEMLFQWAEQEKLELL